MRAMLFSLENENVNLTHKLPIAKNVVPCEGVYKGKKEKSFLVVNPSQDQEKLIHHLMKESKQECYIEFDKDEIKLIDKDNKVLSKTKKYKILTSENEVLGDSYTKFKNFILEINF